MKRLSYEVKSLVVKARESALLAVETYNRPTANFRSGAFVVLMVIAWTALFHAIFFRKGIKPFRRKENSKRYLRVAGEPWRWELKECLQNYFRDQNPAVRKNLEFFIGLRNKIEHRWLAQLDPEVFGECHAILLNFESLLISEFGERYAIGGGLTYALQFSRKSPSHATQSAQSQQKAFNVVKQWVDEFRSSLSTDVMSDLAYSFKVYLVPKIGNHASKDAIAVEWIPYDPSKPEEMEQYERVVAMIKPKEKPVINLGFLKATQVVDQVRGKLGKSFSLYDLKLCYDHYKIRPPHKAADRCACDTRFCVYDDLHKDYCYKPECVDFLVKELSDELIYRTVITDNKRTVKSNGQT